MLKTLRKIVLWGLAVLLLAATVGWFSLDKETRGLLATVPTNRDLLFWSVPQRDAAFRALDRIALLAQWRTVEPAATPRPLPPGPPLALPLDVDAYMAGQRSAALLIVQGGRLRLERYGLGFDGDGRWTSFSVAKSFTSTLVGAALRDGAIKSLDDKVSDYIPEMKGSAYDDVSVGQLMSMTSGVRWSEDYADPQSDVARFNQHQPESGADALLSYMRRLPRAAPPGTRWNYSTGETNLIGILVSQATGKPLAQYLQEKIWQPAGMAAPATWLLSKTGREISGCCVQAAPRDFARFGQFILEGARPGGQLAMAGSAAGGAAQRGGGQPGAGQLPRPAAAPLGGSAAGGAAQRGGDQPGAGQLPRPAAAPSGGSAAGEAAQRGGSSSQSIVPDGWLAAATRKQADIGIAGRGYGYQWWTYDDGSFSARGIFGQGIFIDPRRALVIVSNGNWAGGARDAQAMAAREDFYRAVQRAVDAEAARPRPPA